VLCAGHAAADRIGDAVNHLSHGKAAIEAEAEAARVAPGGLAEIEGVQGAAQAGLEVPEDGVDPEKKQARPSESTAQPVARFSEAQVAIASLLKLQVYNLLAVNLIGGAATTATMWPQGGFAMLFSIFLG
jgi:hypothetical protein